MREEDIQPRAVMSIRTIIQLTATSRVCDREIEVIVNKNYVTLIRAELFSMYDVDEECYHCMHVPSFSE
jgi:hypothetical protein